MTTNPTTNPNPRAPIADRIAESAAAYAATVAAGPDTVGAVLTHAGNYIIPASTDGMATCPDDVHVGDRRIPITKFPTRPAAIDGSVARNMARCRACRDYRAATNRAARTPVAAPTAPVDGPTVNIDHVARSASQTIRAFDTAAARPAHVPTAGNAPIGR